MLSLILRNLFFTILQPGLVAGLFPYWIVGQNNVKVMFDNKLLLYQYLSTVIFCAGFLILLDCIFRFAVEGRGTLSPADPTKQLVVKGLYQYSRNPMYIGVMLMLIGEAFFFGVPNLWIYAAVVFIGFHLFIRLYEEPRLKQKFGNNYQQYCQKVRRWL